MFYEILLRSKLYLLFLQVPNNASSTVYVARSGPSRNMLNPNLQKASVTSSALSKENQTRNRQYATISSSNIGASSSRPGRY